MSNLFIVIPCYNEEKKLLASEIVDFVKQSDTKIIFVNDGSTDNTLGKLQEVKEIVPENIHIISNTKILKREFAARVFKDPFLSRWLFDVEILRRLQLDMGDLDEVVKEVPLEVWIEKGGSKINLLDLVKVPMDLVSIMIHYRKEKMN